MSTHIVFQISASFVSQLLGKFFLGFSSFTERDSCEWIGSTGCHCLHTKERETKVLQSSTSASLTIKYIALLGQDIKLVCQYQRVKMYYGLDL
jgi:hypothetical protein